jgi:tetratricopeptide (TPR) repeat protein
MPSNRWIIAILVALGLVLIFGDVAYKFATQPKRLVIVGPVLPDSPLGQKMAEARAAERANDHRRAVELYTQALAIEPGPNIISAGLHASRGSSYNSLEVSKEAYADYDQAFRDKEPIPDTSSTPRWYLGRAYAALGLERYKRAKDDLDKVLAMTPNAVKALEWRGIALENLGDPQRALADYKAALAVNPKDEWISERVRLLEGR